MKPSLPWRLARSLLFQLDAERVHHLALASLAAYSRVCPVEPSRSDPSRHPALAREVFGVRFENPLGLAAGFDKDGVAIPALASLGFGFLEVGTVTFHPQPGNDRPRLFRLPNDGALLNRLGFNNQGAACLAERLEAWRKKGRVRVPVGVNLGKSKVVPNEEAHDDYRRSLEAVADLADYFVVNVSSPNTPGLSALQEEDALRRVLGALQDANQRRQTPRPLLLKIAPDLSGETAQKWGAYLPAAPP